MVGEKSIFENLTLATYGCCKGCIFILVGILLIIFSIIILSSICFNDNSVTNESKENNRYLKSDTDISEFISFGRDSIINHFAMREIFVDTVKFVFFKGLNIDGMENWVGVSTNATIQILGPINSIKEAHCMGLLMGDMAYNVTSLFTVFEFALLFDSLAPKWVLEEFNKANKESRETYESSNIFKGVRFEFSYSADSLLRRIELNIKGK